MESSRTPPSREEVDGLLGLDPALGRVWGWRSAAAAIVAVLALGALWLVHSSSTEPRVRYLTEPASRGDLRVLVTATGSVVPTKQVDVSSELSGIVRKVLVDFNDRVKVGQPLAELDTERLQASAESARARLAAARAHVTEASVTLDETHKEYERQRGLAESQFASAQVLERARAAFQRAETALATARAEVAVAQADVKLNETNLAKACICSPIDGIVLSRNVNPGQTVASSLQAPVLFSLAEDLTQMDVEVAVDEADVGQVQPGQAAALSVDAYPERSFPATIRQLRFAPETVQGVVTYKAVLSVDNSELLLRPGMTATAQIKVQELIDVLLVPNAALRFSPAVETAAPAGGSWLGRLLPMPRMRAPSPPKPNGRARTAWILRCADPLAVGVVIGASDGRSTQIVAGELAPGDAVIVDSASAEGT